MAVGEDVDGAAGEAERTLWADATAPAALETRVISDRITPVRTVGHIRREFLMGPAGSGVWNPPTLDVKNKRIYVGTGNSYIVTANGDTDDAIMAFDMETGARLWWTHWDGGAIGGTGPAIVDGMVFIGSGFRNGSPGNVLLAFGVE
jgi:outer membrane protein assembly factor BamB